MKRFTTQWLGLLALLLVCSTYSLNAQESEHEQIVVVQKITLEDGSTSVVKKKLEKGADVKQYIQSLGESNGKEVEVRIFTNDQVSDHADAEDGEKVMIFRRAHQDGADLHEGMEKMTIIMQDMEKEMEVHQQHFKEKKGSGRPILGIYVDEAHDGAGLKVSSVVNDKGAQAAGIQSGDVITAVNGKSLGSSGDLRAALSSFKPGDSVNVTYLRDGQTSTTDLVLSESSDYSWTSYRDPCKVFIGVSLAGHGPEGKGVKVIGIIGDTPAEQYGIERGDIITAIDGINVNTVREIQTERDKHDQGDFFTVTVIRDEVSMNVDAQFKTCEKEEEEVAEEELVEEAVEEIIVEEVLEEQEEEEEEEIEILEEKIVEEKLPESPVFEIDNTLQLEELTTFPNPTMGKMRLEFRGESVPTTVQVLDLNGKVIYKEVLNQFDGYYNKQLNFQNVTPGTLFVNIRQGDKMITEKIILLNRA